MPVTTLNRTIAMFIVGGAPLAWWLVRHLEQVASTAEAHKDAGAIMAILTAFVLIPLTAVLGTIAEGLADRVRFKLIHKATHNRMLAGFFWHATEYDHLKYWTDKTQERYPRLVLRDGKGEDHTLSFLAGYFLANASKEQIDWLNSHYSAYTLSSSLALVAPVVAGFDIFFYGDVFQGGLCGCGLVLEIALIAVATYLMLSFAIDMFLYSYHMVARFTYLDLTKE